MRKARRQPAFQRIQPIDQLRPSKLLVTHGPEELLLSCLQLDCLALQLFDLSSRLGDRLLVYRSPLAHCSRRRVLELPDPCSLSVDSALDCCEFFLRLCELPRGIKDSLFLELEPRDENLRADAGAGYLSDLCAQRSDLREQGIRC